MISLRNIFVLGFWLSCVSVSSAQVEFYIDKRKCAGKTAREASLLEAVSTRDEASVRLLLERGADPKLQDDCGIRILTYATAASHPGIMKLLIGAGADVNAADRSIYKFPLAQAINITDPDNRYAVIKVLIDAGANVNVEYGKTPLMEAVSKEDIRLVELLIASKADVNLQDDDACGAYCFASVLGNQKLKKLLVDAGADPTVGAAKYRKEWGEHAFFQAAADGRVDVVEAMLIDQTATVNMTNGLRVTALMRAHHDVMVDALLRAGAEVDLQDNRGYTALMWAAEAGRASIVKKLIAAGADVNLRRNDGKTVIEMICDGEIEKLLKQAGAKRQKYPT